MQFVITPDFVKQTTIISIVAQVVGSLFGIQGLTVTVPPEHQILKQSLIVEMVVQIVELFFYVSYVTSFQLDSLASKRYFDWYLTTPTMLFTTMAFFKYQEGLEKGDGKIMTLSGFWREHRRDILLVTLCNFLMLLLGYLGEVSIMPMLVAWATSFIFFFYTFYIIYERYASKSVYGTNMFWLFFASWLLYGIAFLFRTEEKNIAFNVLDIISKNVFGVFLAYKINKVRS
jgi:hypothetical protein